MIPSPAATPTSSKIIPMAVLGTRENEVSHQNTSDLTLCVPQRSGVIGRNVNEMVAFCTQEAQNVLIQMKQMYAMKLGVEENFTEILEAEGMRPGVLEAKIAALKEELRTRDLCTSCLSGRKVLAVGLRFDENARADYKEASTPWAHV